MEMSTAYQQSRMQSEKVAWSEATNKDKSIQIDKNIVLSQVINSLFLQKKNTETVSSIETYLLGMIVTALGIWNRTTTPNDDFTTTPSDIAPTAIASTSIASTTVIAIIG